MNAHVSPARAIRGLISDLAARYDNAEAALIQGAVDAAEAGRPAYWTRATYHHAVGRLFLLSANRAGLSSALAEWADERHPLKTAEALLATLIPLNTLAIDALQSAKNAAWWASAPGAA